MDPDLERLIQLQELENDLRRLRAELDELPGKKAALEAALEKERSQLDTARETLEESQRNRRHNEGRLQDLETKRSKYKGQLMEVKTNKEYTAMLHEIETVEKEISSREDQILEEMEKAESLAADVKREEGTFREVEEEARKEGHELDVRQTGFEEQRKKVVAEQERIAATIPEGPLGLYRRVAKLRGTGMAEARDGVCQACHVKMRPQPWVELRQGEQLFQCEACNRILYYEPPPTVVEP